MGDLPSGEALLPLDAPPKNTDDQQVCMKQLASRFRHFMRFYSSFSFGSTVVSTRLGKFCPLLQMPQITRNHSADALLIEDPIETDDNPASTVSRQGLERISVELRYAAELSDMGYTWVHMLSAKRPALVTPSSLPAAQNSPRLFVDLDGTLADFDLSVQQHLGSLPQNMNANQMWEGIKKVRQVRLVMHNFP